MVTIVDRVVDAVNVIDFRVSGVFSLSIEESNEDKFDDEVEPHNMHDHEYQKESGASEADGISTLERSRDDGGMNESIGEEEKTTQYPYGDEKNARYILNP